MKLLSRAKINLFLDIVGQDEKDGYHFIDSLFQEITLADEIIVEDSPLKKDIITFSNMSELNENSTIHKVLNFFRQNFKINDFFKIEVKKRIPSGAGLGGGSSNAGTIIEFLKKKYNFDENECIKIASKVGSDVPFFLYGGLCRVGGKGEKIKKLNIKLKDIYFIVIYFIVICFLCFPGIHSILVLTFLHLYHESHMHQRYFHRMMKDIPDNAFQPS